MGLWNSIMDEEEFKKDNQLAQTQTEGTDSSNGDSTKKKTTKKSSKKRIQEPEILRISFEYPLPKWNTPTIFSAEEFLQQSF